MKKYILLSLLMLCSSLTWAQKSVSGIVIDNVDKTPLLGATLMIKGTTRGTVTDFDGHFTLSKVNKNAVLVVSYLGYTTQEVRINGRTNLMIALKNDANLLEDVVVVGYGSTKRSDLTGSVASVNADNLVQTATSNFDEALAGRVAGVEIGSSDGTPGEKQNIVIRGGNSITGDNTPLYVVDGLALEDFDPATLSTSNIADFQILKDASATAIYGSRGANGVIIISTKKGSNDGKSTVNVSLSHRYDWIPQRVQVLGAQDFVEYYGLAQYARDNFVPSTYYKSYLYSMVSPSLYSQNDFIDWQDKVFRGASTDDLKVSVSSGNKTTSFYYSGEYLNQEGTMINTSFKKLNNSLRVNHKFSSKARIDMKLEYSNLSRNGLSVRGNSFTSVIRDVLQFRPIENKYNKIGDSGYDPNDPAFKYYFDPVKNMVNTDRTNKQDVIRGSANYSYDIIKNLTFRTINSFQLDKRKESTFSKKDTYNGTRGINGISGQIKNREYTVLSSSNTLSYNGKIKGGHKYSAMLGMEISNRVYDYSYFANNQLPTDELGIYKLDLGTNPAIPETLRSESGLVSYFTRLTYNYKERYLFTGTMRADGSSKFKNNKWGYFPSFSFAWRANQESFLKDVEWLSNLKFRAGWGITGNNRVSDFSSYNQLSVSKGSGYVWGTGEEYKPGVYQSNVGVPDLKWEKTAQTNVGLDFGFFKQRLTATVDYYYKRTSDLLLNAEMALHTGFDKIQQNVGVVQNTGLEFEVNSVNIQHKNFNWKTSFNISFNRNKVKALNQGQQAIYTDPNWDYSFAEYQYITALGEPVGMIYGLQFDRLYQNSDFEMNNESRSLTLKEGIPDNGASAVAPGSLKFVDQNNDGTINEQDRVIIGDPHPDHIGGLSNSFRFYNFDASFLFQWAYGFDILNANKVKFGAASGNYNGLESVKDMWTPYNTTTEQATTRYLNVFGTAPQGNQLDDRFVEDGSYLKLKSITIGYTVPSKYLHRFGLNKVRVYVSGNNLLTWTSYDGYDPNVSVGKYGALTPALDYSAYPSSSSVMGGLNIVF